MKDFIARSARRLAFLPGRDSRLDRARALLDSDRPGRGITLLGKLAAAGDADARYELGTVYLEGRYVPRHLGEGIRWVRAAAEAGQADAAFRMALLHQAGTAGSAQTGRTPLSETVEAGPPDLAAALG